MKLLVFGKSSSYAEQLELNRMLERVERELTQIERIDSNSRNGIGQMEAYDIVSTPAFAVVRDDGTALAMWQYTRPTFNDIAAYFGAV